MIPLIIYSLVVSVLCRPSRGTKTEKTVFLFTSSLPLHSTFHSRELLGSGFPVNTDLCGKRYCIMSFWQIVEMNWRNFEILHYIALIMLSYICTNALFPSTYSNHETWRMTLFDQFFLVILCSQQATSKRTSSQTCGYAGDGRTSPCFHPKSSHKNIRYKFRWFKNHTGTKWMNM